MLTPRISLVNYKTKKIKTNEIKNNLIDLVKNKNQIINSLSKNYKNNFNKQVLKKYKNSLNYRVIGMGGSSLGTKAIYNFLKHKIKKNFVFFDNLKEKKKGKKIKKIYQHNCF